MVDAGALFHGVASDNERWEILDLFRHRRRTCAPDENFNTLPWIWRRRGVAGDERQKIFFEPAYLDWRRHCVFDFLPISPMANGGQQALEDLT